MLSKLKVSKLKSRQTKTSPNSKVAILVLHQNIISTHLISTFCCVTANFNSLRAFFGLKNLFGRQREGKKFDFKRLVFWKPWKYQIFENWAFGSHLREHKSSWKTTVCSFSMLISCEHWSNPQFLCHHSMVSKVCWCPRSTARTSF